MEIPETEVPSEMWKFVWQTFANASMTYDLVSSQNVTKGNTEYGILSFENPAKLGILTGFVIAYLADFRIATSKFQMDVCLDSKLRTMSIALLNVMIFLCLAPIITTILTSLFIYRKFVELLLRIKLKKEFAGLLEGTDCVWALETSTSLSVINVLAILETNDTPNDDFLHDFRNLIEKSLLSSNFDKLNWLREKEYGYHYWRRSDQICIEERVRWMDDDEHERCDGTCEDVDGKFLKNILMKVMNKCLPRRHSTSWEILVGRTCSKSFARRIAKMEEGLMESGEKGTRCKTTIPIVFRVHHCLGDGVALLRLLLESIADSNTSMNNDPTTKAFERKIRIPLLRKSSSVLGIARNEEEIIYNEKDCLVAAMPFATRIPLLTIVKSILTCIDDSSKNPIVFELREKIVKVFDYSWNALRVNVLEVGRKRLNEVIKFLSIIISIPNCLLQQALRSMDNSALHGPTLSGEKLLTYWMESDSKDSPMSNLLEKIRDIKNATGSRFGDVVLAALSENLHRYYSKIGEAAPKTMTVVIPARMTVPSQKLSLQNDFSVGLLTLCCSELNGESLAKDIPEETRLFERLGDVARSSEKLRNEPDYLINFWVMKWLSAALPESLLRPVLESHSTLVFSNLPGPQEVSIIGHRLKNVTFWIPNRGSTGLGCSFLTYGGKVHVSLAADRALIQNQNHLDDILRDSIEDIEKLYRSISLSSPTTSF